MTGWDLRGGTRVRISQEDLFLVRTEEGEEGDVRGVSTRCMRWRAGCMGRDNAGVLRYAQDDGEERATARAKATATAKARANAGSFVTALLKDDGDERATAMAKVKAQAKAKAGGACGVRGWGRGRGEG
jgi:hypothetical protein